MKFVRLSVTLAFALSFASLAVAAPDIFPLKDVRAGQHGVGRTVFSGTKVEEFQVEVLGVLENLGPRQSIILARLSGGPLANTGVMQGMSGSPVYIDGKLLGAVALSFPLSKEAIAGIRPIEDMLHVNPQPPQNHCSRDAARGRSSRGTRSWKKLPRRFRSPDLRPRRWNISHRSFASWVSIRARGFRAAATFRTVWAIRASSSPGR